MNSDKKDNNAARISTGRRKVLQAGAAGALALGFPAIVRAQSDSIKIGHLTPLTGFLGALGAYAVLGKDMAVEEINAAGGIMGRKLEVISEDSVNPATAATKAQRMLERDGASVLIGEINSGSAQDHHAGGGAQQAPVHEHRRAFRRAARQGLQPLHLPRRHPGDRDGQRGRPGAGARQSDEGQEVLQPDFRLPVRARSRQGRQGVLRGQRRQSDRRRTDPHRCDRLQPVSAQDPPGEARRGLDQPRRQPGHELRQAICRVRPAVSGGRLQPQHGRCLGRGRRQPGRHLADVLAPRP